MTPYTTAAKSNKTDRISRAVRIIETGKVQPQADGLFRVLSDRPNTAYTVTAERCGCPDFEHLKGESPCKHQWAAIGATAAMLIHQLRSAESIAALEAIGKAYAAAMQAMPDAFVSTARNEYRRRHAQLTATDWSKVPGYDEWLDSLNDADRAAIEQQAAADAEASNGKAWGKGYKPPTGKKLGGFDI